MPLHEFSDGLGMSPSDDDVKVSNAVLQQIGFQVHVERDLRATEMVAVRHFDGLRFRDEITVKVRAAPFE